MDDEEDVIRYDPSIDRDPHAGEVLVAW